VPRHLRFPWPHGHPRPVLVSVPAITTNLDGTSDHFAQVAVTLELRDAAAAHLFSAREAAVLDAVIADLRGETFADLSGDAGMRLLGQRIAASLDPILGGRGAVEAVYFTQFVVQ